MKKLLGVIGILALATALLPAQGHADLRGAFGPITLGAGFINGTEQAALRPVDADGIMLYTGDAGGRLIEMWTTFSTRSLVPGRESVRSIYTIITQQQAVGVFGPTVLAPLRHHPNADFSYFDPAWSPDARFLAYVQTDADGANQAIYVQEFLVADGTEGDYGPGNGCDSPIGSPILVTTAGDPRHPHWAPTGHTLAWDSNSAGTYDIYTADIDVTLGTASSPTRRTFVDNRAETDPAWAPNGHELAYATNKFGPRVIEIIDLDLSPVDAAYTRLAERNFAFVTHSNPAWTSNGESIYYDAPSGEDASAVTNIWKLDLATQAKCEIQFDIRADADPDVSRIVNFSNAADGSVPFNYFMFTSQAAGSGVLTWKGNPIHSCLLPLAMGVATVPAVLDLNDEDSETFKVVFNFPPETRAAGYRCRSTNASGNTIDGVRLRGSILNSPTLMGLGLSNNPATGTLLGPGGPCFDSTASGLPDSFRIYCNWDFRTIADRVVDLGLVNTIVPMKAQAYSNILGRGFQGFAYVRLTASSLQGASVAMLGSSPNPFNPVTKIKFAVNKPGNYALRLYNVQGALIRTVASRHFEAGTHEATWDGRTNGGGMAASGVYYAKMSGASKGTGSDGIKLVLSK